MSRSLRRSRRLDGGEEELVGGGGDVGDGQSLDGRGDGGGEVDEEGGVRGGEGVGGEGGDDQGGGQEEGEGGGGVGRGGGGRGEDGDGAGGGGPPGCGVELRAKVMRLDASEVKDRGKAGLTSASFPRVPTLTRSIAACFLADKGGLKKVDGTCLRTPTGRVQITVRPTCLEVSPKGETVVTSMVESGRRLTEVMVWLSCERQRGEGQSGGGNEGATAMERRLTRKVAPSFSA